MFIIGVFLQKSSGLSGLFSDQLRRHRAKRVQPRLREKPESEGSFLTRQRSPWLLWNRLSQSVEDCYTLCIISVPGISLASLDHVHKYGEDKQTEFIYLAHGFPAIVSALLKISNRC